MTPLAEFWRADPGAARNRNREAYAGRLQDMVTRREIMGMLAGGMGIAFQLSGAAPKTPAFWETKPPTEWTDDEIRLLLSRSPWAREAQVSFNNGPGILGDPISRPGVPTRGIIGSPGSSPNDAKETNQLQGVVRWESALPIQQALRAHARDGRPPSEFRKEDEFRKFYVINVLGDLPSMSSSGTDLDRAQQETRLDMMRAYTKLERKDDPIFLERIASGAGNGTWFYFSRQESIRPSDKQITFSTKLGPLEVKARFTLKDMMYHGNLEL